MRVEETTDGTRVHLEPGAYRDLRRASETYREELVLRLGAEVGLRPAEITRIQPQDTRIHEYNGRDHHFLAVPDGNGGSRLAYLPEAVEHDLRQFAQATGVGDDERYVPVTARRVQMLVSELADRAADRTGDDRFQQVSSRTLRRYFAKQLLAEEQVDPRIVQSVGGWERIESLAPYLDDPTLDDIAAAFEQATVSDRQEGAAADETAPDMSESVSLDRFDTLIEGLRRVGEGLTTASTREEVERTTCEQLVEVGCYQFAWFGQRAGEHLRVTAQAGIDAEAFDGLTGTDGAVGRALSDGTVRVTTAVDSDDGFATWQEYGSDAGAVIPVTDSEQTYGVLGIGADATDAITDRERTLLTDLGKRVGQAITAAEQRKFLLADTAIELSFECRDTDSFFATASARHDCSLSMDGVVPGEEQSLLYFVTLADAKPDAFLEWAPTTAAITDARLVRDYGDESLVELVVDGPDISSALVQHGATIREMHAEAGVQEVVGEVPADSDVRTLVDEILARFPETDLLTKREREQPTESLTAFRSSLRENLTEKQAAVLQAAYHAGYFEWPRGSTAEELAAAIGITSPTLHNHLRRAQQKLLTAFYTEEQSRDEEMPWTE